MGLFPRWHTPHEVAKRLIDGLENGTLELAPPAPDVTEMIAEAIDLTAAINAVLARVDPGYVPPEGPTAERLAGLERSAPGAVPKALARWREIYARATALEAQKRALARRRVVWRGARVVLFVAPVACFLYLLSTRSAAERVDYALAFLAGLAVSAGPRLLGRARGTVRENARLLSAVAELVPQVRLAADTHPG